MLASKAIVERFIDLDFESGDAEEEDSTTKPKREDYIQSYACKVLTLDGVQ